MPVGIYMVLNNTLGTLHYNNTESKHTLTIPPKEKKHIENDWIPSSKYANDTVPYKGSGKINVRIDDGPTVSISDHDYQFCMVGPVGSTSKSVEDNYGLLNNGGHYMLVVDVNFDGIQRRAAFTFLQALDEDKLQVNEGYVPFNTLQHAARPVAANLQFNILPQPKPKAKAEPEKTQPKPAKK